MSKFYSVQAFQEMVDQYVANGFSTSAAEKMVNDEEATSMSEFDEFLAEVKAQTESQLNAEEWMDILDPTSYYSGDIDN